MGFPLPLFFVGKCSISGDPYKYNTLPPLPAQRNLTPPPTLYPQQPVSSSNLEKACKNSNLIEYKPLGQLGEYTLNDTIITLSTLKTYFIIYIDNLKITNAHLKLIKRNTNCKYLCYKSNIYFRFIYKWYKQLRVNNIKDTYLSFLLYIFYF